MTCKLMYLSWRLNISTTLLSFRAPGNAFSIFKDSSHSSIFGHQPEMSKVDIKPWQSLGARAERNKENTAIPSKWTSNKVILNSSLLLHALWHSRWLRRLKVISYRFLRDRVKG